MKRVILEKLYSGLPYINLLKKIGIEINDLVEFGGGENGLAYRYHDGVIKVTGDIYEARLYSKLVNKNLMHLPKVYKVFVTENEKNENIYIILMEFVENVGHCVNDTIDFLLMDFNNIEDESWFNYDDRSFDKFEAQLLEKYDCDNEDSYDYDEISCSEIYNFIEMMKSLYNELHLIDIRSVRDLKTSHIGCDEDGFRYIDLQIYDVMDGFEEGHFKKI